MNLSGPDSRSRSSGHTLLELLIVLGLMGLLTAWALQVRPSEVPAATAAIRTQVLQSRFESIERGTPVAVIYLEGENTFLVRDVGELSIGQGCESGVVLERIELAEFGGVEANVSGKGLVWLPSGTGRTCSGGGAFNQTITLSDGVRQGRVIVSRAGRVRSELRR